MDKKWFFHIIGIFQPFNYLVNPILVSYAAIGHRWAIQGSVTLATLGLFSRTWVHSKDSCLELKFLILQKLFIDSNQKQRYGSLRNSKGSFETFRWLEFEILAKETWHFKYQWTSHHFMLKKYIYTSCQREKSRNFSWVELTQYVTEWSKPNEFTSIQIGNWFDSPKLPHSLAF